MLIDANDKRELGTRVVNLAPAGSRLFGQVRSRSGIIVRDPDPDPDFTFFDKKVWIILAIFSSEGSNSP